MGRVYLAEQLRPVHRDVALKLIREQVASPLARAYFDVERQALAQMQHPAIAQVFDAGTTEQGYPYLAMEVVEGVPITRFCREQQLGRDARLALFARVCHGVQHAHQKGIIHRDLKPANVLVRRVDGTPMPKIIDFGIAIGGVAGSDGIAAEATATDRAGTSLYMYRGLATVLIAMGRYADAEHELDRAWTVFTAAPGYGAGHPRSQEVVDSYIALYDAWKNPDKKAEWVARKVAPKSAAG